jgi:hypothetical protein
VQPHRDDRFAEGSDALGILGERLPTHSHGRLRADGGSEKNDQKTENCPTVVTSHRKLLLLSKGESETGVSLPGGCQADASPISSPVVSISPAIGGELTKGAKDGPAGGEIRHLRVSGKLIACRTLAVGAGRNSLRGNVRPPAALNHSE